MPRIYLHTFSAVNVGSTGLAAAADLLLLPGPSAGKLCKVRRFWIGTAGDATLAAGQPISLRMRYLPATVTPGSGGTGSLTPVKVDQGDSTCSITTARRSDTTIATTNGTAVLLWQGAVHIYQGIDWVFPELSQPRFANATAITLEQLAAPTGTVTISGGIEFSEEG